LARASVRILNIIGEGAMQVQAIRMWLLAVVASLGGFLFGLDLGVMGPMLESAYFKRDVAHLVDWQDPSSEIPNDLQGHLVSLFALGCLLTSIPHVSEYLTSSHGRVAAMAFASVVFILGCWLQASSNAMWPMLLSRVISGSAVGICGTVCVTYQTEIAPANKRGAMGTLFQLAITFGIFSAALLGYCFVDEEGGWRVARYLHIVPAAVLLLSTPFMPSSPRWLVQEGRPDEALTVLRLIRTDGDARQEHFDMVSHQEARSESKEESNVRRSRIGSRFNALTMKYLGVAFTILLLVQFNGMAVFYYFGPRIFKEFGFGQHMNLLNAVAAGVNFLATVPAVGLVDVCGRRVFLMLGSLGMALIQIAMGCIGSFGLTAGDTQEMWVAYVVFSLVCAFKILFAISWGAIGLLYCTEMLPTRIRSFGLGFASLATWGGNYLMALFTPILLGTIGYSLFWILAGICLFGFFFAMRLPETKGQKLEDLEARFETFFGHRSKGEAGSETKGDVEGDAADEASSSTAGVVLKVEV